MKYKFILIITALLFGIANAKETIIVVQRAGTFKFNFKTLYSPNERALVLVATKDAKNKFPKGQEIYFDDILITDDFSDDGIEQQCVKAIQTFASSPEEVRIVTGNESNMIAVGKIRKRLHLPGPYLEEILPFRDKLVMKEKMAKKNISIPKHIHYENQDPQKIAQELSFPIFAKLVDGAGSINASKIHNLDELTHWCKEHEGNDNYELDEWISGSLYHCESIIQNGKSIFSWACQSIPNAEFLNEKNVGSYTLDSSHPDFAALIEFNRKVLEALEPVPDGVTHLEFFKDLAGNLIFLEIACRPPGAWIHEIYEDAFGINLQEAHFKGQAGLKYELPPKKDLPMYAGCMWFPCKDGIISAQHDPKLKSQYQISWLKNMGDKTLRAKHVLDATGGCHFWNNNLNDLIEDFNYLSQEFSSNSFIN